MTTAEEKKKINEQTENADPLWIKAYEQSMSELQAPQVKGVDMPKAERYNLTSYQKAYYAAQRQLETDYAKSQVTYGTQAEKLGTAGLASSGYADYLRGADRAAYINASTATADAYQQAYDKALADAIATEHLSKIKLSSSPALSRTSFGTNASNEWDVNVRNLLASGNNAEDIVKAYKLQSLNGDTTVPADYESRISNIQNELINAGILQPAAEPNAEFVSQVRNLIAQGQSVDDITNMYARESYLGNVTLPDNWQKMIKNEYGYAKSNGLLNDASGLTQAQITDAEKQIDTLYNKMLTNDTYSQYSDSGFRKALINLVGNAEISDDPTIQTYIDDLIERRKTDRDILNEEIGNAQAELSTAEQKELNTIIANIDTIYNRINEDEELSVYDADNKIAIIRNQIGDIPDKYKAEIDDHINDIINREQIGRDIQNRQYTTDALNNIDNTDDITVLTEYTDTDALVKAGFVADNAKRISEAAQNRINDLYNNKLDNIVNNKEDITKDDLTAMLAEAKDNLTAEQYGELLKRYININIDNTVASNQGNNSKNNKAQEPIVEYTNYLQLADEAGNEVKKEVMKNLENHFDIEIKNEKNKAFPDIDLVFTTDNGDKATVIVKTANIIRDYNPSSTISSKSTYISTDKSAGEIFTENGINYISVGSIAVKLDDVITNQNAGSPEGKKLFTDFIIEKQRKSKIEKETVADLGYESALNEKLKERAKR